jgi:hypothetical protein
MSTKHIRTAADLVRFGAGLKIECLNCGSARTLTGTEMVAFCGNGSLADASIRLKCQRCGRKGPRLVVLPPL